MLESAVLLSEECVHWYECRCGNPLMKTPVVKIMNTELFIERTATLDIGEARIRAKTNKCDQQFGTS